LARDRKNQACARGADEGPTEPATFRLKLVAAIKSERRHGNLSSAIRLFVLDFYRQQISR
jgi:hypothetical protein